MMTRFALRNKKTGQFLSASRYYGGGREWVEHINDAHLFRRPCDAANAARHIQEVKEWAKATDRRYIPSLSRTRHLSEYPVELVTFNVLLIDARVGYIG